MHIERRLSFIVFIHSFTSVSFPISSYTNDVPVYLTIISQSCLFKPPNNLTRAIFPRPNRYLFLSLISIFRARSLPIILKMISPFSPSKGFYINCIRFYISIQYFNISFSSGLLPHIVISFPLLKLAKELLIVNPNFKNDIFG